MSTAHAPVTACGSSGSTCRDMHFPVRAQQLRLADTPPGDDFTNLA